MLESRTRMRDGEIRIAFKSVTSRPMVINGREKRRIQSRISKIPRPPL
jgi:hypothetical protein